MMLFARNEPPADVAPGVHDVALYRDARCRNFVACFPWHYSNCPKRGARKATVNGVAYDLAWAPTLKPRFNPFPPVPCGYGAPMGRPNGRADLTDDMDLCVAGPAGEYDAGGAYWGYSPSEGPIWAVWERGRGHDGVVYVRARNRDDAKRGACA